MKLAHSRSKTDSSTYTSSLKLFIYLWAVVKMIVAVAGFFFFGEHAFARVFCLCIDENILCISTPFVLKYKNVLTFVNTLHLLCM